MAQLPSAVRRNNKKGIFCKRPDHERSLQNVDRDDEDPAASHSREKRPRTKLLTDTGALERTHIARVTAALTKALPALSFGRS